MIYLFYIFAGLLVWFSYRSFRGGMDYLSYFKKESGNTPTIYLPFVSVIAPIKGVDDGLRENLSALATQNYPSFEVIFVVDDAQDPAVSIVKGLSETIPKSLSTKLIVARKATASAQKAENLREGVLHTDSRSDAFVFVDSDARPSSEWLRSLIRPLNDTTIGATTGYRWYISETATFASELRGMWNASIASALGPNQDGNFCWGGSMAMRRDTFEKLKISERWRNIVSDDFAVTTVLREAGLRIKFVPQALTASIGNCSVAELFEFTNRQMKITRVYAQNLWLLSFFGSGLFTVVVIAATYIALTAKDALPFWFSVAVLSLKIINLVQ
ncbi:glycosyltransferase [Leptolyngbya sp. 7M]|uniref:glycosyltransferase n=1 Tax=Leptolyngbya sp. 7M TaxID=2812896 RepID=UPI001B8B4C09|nr:glycosyltransferase [Leptolyngbya sp. 7M]QYO64525.1 glycosyltransferase [Leptolyngbya sp. 7M]